jgi:hypothetical protein
VLTDKIEVLPISESMLMKVLSPFSSSTSNFELALTTFNNRRNLMVKEVKSVYSSQFISLYVTKQQNPNKK